jgi:hypothetical protein
MIDVIPDEEIKELTAYVIATYSGSIGMALADNSKLRAALDKKKKDARADKDKIRDLEEKLLKATEGDDGTPDDQP